MLILTVWLSLKSKRFMRQMSLSSARDTLNAVMAISFFRISLSRLVCGYSLVVVSCDSIINWYHLIRLTKENCVFWEDKNVGSDVHKNNCVNTMKNVTKHFETKNTIEYGYYWMMIKDNRDRSTEMSSTIKVNNWSTFLFILWHLMLIRPEHLEAYQLSCVFKWSTESIWFLR